MKGKSDAERQRFSRSVLRQLGLSRDAINEIGSDAPRIAQRMLLAAPDVNRLAANVRNELLNNARLASQVVRDAGLTPIQIRLLGGPKRIVRNTERLLRNPPRAIGEFFKDTARNLRGPTACSSEQGGPSSIATLLRASSAALWACLE